MSSNPESTFIIDPEGYTPNTLTLAIVSGAIKDAFNVEDGEKTVSGLLGNRICFVRTQEEGVGSALCAHKRRVSDLLCVHTRGAHKRSELDLLCVQKRGGHER